MTSPAAAEDSWEKLPYDGALPVIFSRQYSFPDRM